jgi:hypothetical protein
VPRIIAQLILKKDDIFTALASRQNHLSLTDKVGAPSGRELSGLEFLRLLVYGSLTKHFQSLYYKEPE